MGGHAQFPRDSSIVSRRRDGAGCSTLISLFGRSALGAVGHRDLDVFAGVLLRTTSGRLDSTYSSALDRRRTTQTHGRLYSEPLVVLERRHIAKLAPRPGERVAH